MFFFYTYSRRKDLLIKFHTIFFRLHVMSSGLILSLNLNIFTFNLEEI